MRRLVFVVSVLGICSSDILPQNIITVPPNCPQGQEWVNGACRDIWKIALTAGRPIKVTSDTETQNMITVPPNCPPGQQWINGQCRDVWRGGAPAPSDMDVKNMITVPVNCPPGQQYINGQCRDVWRAGVIAYAETDGELLQAQAADVETDKSDLVTAKVPLRIIKVPNQCPVGYRLDAHGICRRAL